MAQQEQYRRWPFKPTALEIVVSAVLGIAIFVWAGPLMATAPGAHYDSIHQQEITGVRFIVGQIAIWALALFMGGGIAVGCAHFLPRWRVWLRALR